jgi:DNA-binding YbaB/EbfC family protein
VERELRERIVEGTAGGGAVKVFVNGLQEVQAVKIAPEAVDPDDVETLEDLVTVAVRQAVDSSRRLREAEMGKVTGGLSLPGLGF